MAIFFTNKITNAEDKNMTSSATEDIFFTPSDANYLTLFFIPSPEAVDWASPQSVLISQIKNHFSLQARNLGHVNVNLKCRNGAEILTGMTGQNMDSKFQLFIKGAGFGILWHSFKGALEQKESLQEELPQLSKQKRLSFVRLKISDSVCAKLTNYLDEYKSEDKQKNYGLANRPRFGEGAGCTAFGVSFLEIANLLQKESKEWNVNLSVPISLLGKPVSDQFVPIWKILFSKSWAAENEPHKKISFWDPDLMHQWVHKKYHSQESNQVESFKKIKIGDTLGLYYDYSNLKADDSPIWLTENK